jgi:hypothetical protein
MGDINSVGVAEIIKAARQGHDTKIVDVGEMLGIVAPVLLGPDEGGGMSYDSLKEEIDKWRDRPERYEGTARLEDLASFIAHANRFKDADSAIFISSDPAKPSFLSVLDYHETKNAAHAINESTEQTVPVAGSPRFGKHRGSYVPVFSDEWKAWTEAAKRPLSQAEFAALIQSRARDIFDVMGDDYETGRLGDLASWFAKRFARSVSPHEFYGDAQRMLDCSEGLTATITETVGDVAKMGSTGETRITFGADTKTSVDIPAAFVIEVPIFRGGDLWQLPVRVRYTVRVVGDTKRAEWRLEVFGGDRTIADVVKDMGKTVRDATGLPVFVGSPE